MSEPTDEQLKSLGKIAEDLGEDQLITLRPSVVLAIVCGAQRARELLAAARPVASRLFTDVALMDPEEQAEVVKFCDAVSYSDTSQPIKREKS